MKKSKIFLKALVAIPFVLLSILLIFKIGALVLLCVPLFLLLLFVLGLGYALLGNKKTDEKIKKLFDETGGEK